jgi:hypothetical protein
MTVKAAHDLPWWKATPKGKIIPLAFVKIDRVGSGDDWNEGVPTDVVYQLRARYTSAVDEIARIMDAAQPLNWQGDGTMMFLTDGRMSCGQPDEPAPVRAFHAAKTLWERVRIDLNIKVRIGVHAAHVSWNPETGKLAHAAIDHCGHLEKAAPGSAVAVSEDVCLMLPARERRDFAPLGIMKRDGLPAYVFPAPAAARRDATAFIQSEDLKLWDAFRAYARGPEIRLLRYVGFPTTKKQPPCLDVGEVFVVPEVTTVPRRSPKPPEARLTGPATTWGREPPKSAAHKENASSPPHKELKADGRDCPFEQMEDSAQATMSAPLDRFFRENRSLVLLGDPGSGKTTAIRWLASMAATGRFEMNRTLGVAERLLPLPVSVGRLAETLPTLGKFPAVLDALALYFHNRNIGGRDELRKFFAARLEAGECLVLLDGLDEVKAEQSAAIHAWLEGFAAVYYRNRFVATSRRVGYM